MSIAGFCYLLNDTMKLLIIMKEAITAMRRRGGGGNARAVNLRTATGGAQEIEMGENPSPSSGSANGERTSLRESGDSSPARNARGGESVGSNKPVGYEDIAKWCFGLWGSRIMNVIVFSTNIGISIGYLALIKNGFLDDET